MKNETPFPGQVAFRVGFDLGSSSIGWAIVQFAWDESNQDWQPLGIPEGGVGVRIFPAGTEGDIEAGRDESRAVKRRNARGARRNLARRAGRMHKLFLALVKAELLPLPPNLNKGPLAPIIDQTIKELDLELIRMGGDSALLPYHLRTKALDYQLTPFELGRTLYHLAQRRGFKSNKRADSKTNDEEKGKVKGGIKIQREKMQEKGARTIGELLFKEDPEAERIRARYNARDMIEDEFNAIWDKQRQFHANLLSDNLREQIHDCIFFQRKLKPVDHLVGYCSLEPGKWITVKRYTRRDGRPLDKPRHVTVFKAPRRLALADPLAQRIRLLQKLNDLKIYHSIGTTSCLAADQRAWLLDSLQKGDVSLKDLRKQFCISKSDKFNFEGGPAKTLTGDRSAEKLRGILGAIWDSYTELEKSRLVYQILKAQDVNVLKAELEAEWNFNSDIATKLADVTLEDGYIAFSRTACEKLLPGLEAGQSLNTIREEIYGASKPKEAVTELPIVAIAFPDLRNPAVSRVLTELRKVTKAIIRKWGLPQSFTLELARDLKKTREVRKAITEKIKDRTKEREKAKKALEGFVASPKARDIEKYLLWEECGGPLATCPYTGKPIALTELFSSQSPWDIEHIIPYSRSLDDSFANKTLCCSGFNRNRKHNKLPMELGPEIMEGILDRVSKWKSDSKTEKLRRFRLEKIDSDFISSQLNDTAYATRLACDYLAMLYGGRYDSEQQRIRASKGQATAKLRDMWDMNKLLGGFEKNRGDHRHHALDALVIALTTPSAMKTLSNASKTHDIHRLRFSQIAPPWDDFLKDAELALGRVVISRQLQGKLSGRLHEETNYGKIQKDDAANKVITSRIPIEALTVKDLKPDFEIDGIGIINLDIKARVLAKIEELGIDDPKKAFKVPENHPYLQTKSGKRIPIHKVKLAYNQKTVPVGEKYRTRHVVSDSNHHMAIFETKDSRGQPKWTYEVVSLLEAIKRHAKGEPIVDKKPGFKMTLRAGDTVRYVQDGEEVHAWVRTVASTGHVGITIHIDARKKEEQIKAKTFQLKTVDGLRKLCCEKTTIDPLGEIRISRD